MDPTGIIAIITVTFTGLSALVATIFQNSSLSRCTEIDLFCCHCVRDVLDEKELKEMNEIITHSTETKPVGK